MSENEGRIEKQLATKTVRPNDALFIVNANCKVIYFNEAAKRFTGLGFADLMGADFKSLFIKKADEQLPCICDDIQAGRVIRNRRVFFSEKVRREREAMFMTVLPCFNEEDGFDGAVVLLRNSVDETVISELALESIADGVFAVDKDWRIRSFNSAAEKITGWSKEEAIGKRCSEVFHSNICEAGHIQKALGQIARCYPFNTEVCETRCILAKSIEIQRPIANETIFIKRRDGRSLPVSISAAPLLDNTGDVIGGVETFRDITSEVERKLILESIADGVFTVDKDWRITSFNRAAENITGYTAEEAIGRHCHEIFQSSICGEACALANSIKNKTPVRNRSIFIRHKSGKNISISISAAPLLDNTGDVIGGVETFRDISAIMTLRKEITKRYTFGDIISKSAIMRRRVFDILPDIARSDSNVLILGESGTGKELVARAIHNFSRRMKGPFVAVNCGALPDTLLESELFGYKAGAFTDAKKDRPGRFAAAEKGTLFLDEIGDISQALQVKLLRVLQDKVYEPLGSNRPVKADVRILAATNRDLGELVREGRFREDLYYRLNVVKIQLPPLRERKEDIPLLIEHFIAKFNAQKEKEITGISQEAVDRLMQYDFPGNIRELENIIEYAFILCHDGMIQLQHLPEPFCQKTNEELLPAIDSNKPLGLDEIEKIAITKALERNNWRRLATCRELGISKDTLRRKIQRYGIEAPIEVPGEE
ncbi:sigma 54-interacting transcriptional regulator [Dissulfurimicrobium hydrothermale]|uniref:sigma 54-interacting transcriptional regulator n=1 Tax=Dissulfurimicrobium hydrothermale TaxID=1750598 RepID=UPI002ECFB1F8